MDRRSTAAGVGGEVYGKLEDAYAGLGKPVLVMRDMLALYDNVEFIRPDGSLT